jgi:hypothetical protein
LPGWRKTQCAFSCRSRRGLFNHTQRPHWLLIRGRSSRSSCKLCQDVGAEPPRISSSSSAKESCAVPTGPPRAPALNTRSLVRQSSTEPRSTLKSSAIICTTEQFRAAVLRVKREGSCLGQWMRGLESRAARNVVIVATANKLARISWAVLSSGNDYRPMHTAVSCSS